MHRTALVLLRLFGPRGLPGRKLEWEPPMDGSCWEQLGSLWRKELGPFDEIAVGERTQADRTGFALLLLRGGRSLAFVKVRQGGAAALQREGEIIERVVHAGARTFFVPEHLSSGGVGRWRYIAVAPLPAISHSVPRDPPLKRIAAEIGSALADLPRDTGVPAHWMPMHGDLTPWNLRELPDGRMVLFDWEDAAWAPPGADEVLYRASAAAIGEGEVSPHAEHEAIEYWVERIGLRVGASRRDRSLDEALLRILERMRAPGRAAVPLNGGAER